MRRLIDFASRVVRTALARNSRMDALQARAILPPRP
jgi:hypothetical protein